MISQTSGSASRSYTRLERGALLITSVILLITLVAMIAAPLLASQWRQLPFPGFAVEPTLHISSSGDPHWHGYQTGLKNLDRLVAVDGMTVTGANGLNQALRTYRVGDSVEFEFVQYETGQHLTRSLRLVSFGWGDFAWFFVAPYLVGLSYLAIGLGVFRLRYYQPVGRVFALMCCGMALLCGLIFDLFTTHAFTWAWAGGIALAAGALVGLAILFPQEQRLVTRWEILRWSPYALTLVLFICDLITTYDQVNSLAYVLAWRYSYFYGGLGLLAFIGMMTYRRYFSPSPIVRRQSNVILWGALVAFLPIAYFILRTAFGLPTDFIPWVYMPSLILFPLAVAYSILRYRTLDIDLVISRSISYVLLTGVIVGLYFLMINSASLALRSTIEAHSPWLIAALVLAVALLLDPLRDRLQRGVDALFYRGAVDYRGSLQDFSQRLTELVEVKPILTLLHDEIVRAMHPGSTWIYLYDSPAIGYLAYNLPGESRPPTGAVRFPLDSSLASVLSETHTPVYIEADRPLPPTLASEKERLSLLNNMLFVPLRGGRTGASERKLEGWLLLGGKQSGQSYTNDDLDYLLSLADQTTLALDKARIFVDLNRRVDQFSVLSLISQAVTFTLELDDIFELIYTQSSKIIDTSNFYIALSDEQNQMMHMAFYVEQGERLYQDEEWPLGTGLSSEIVRTGRSIVTDDYLTECSRRGVMAGVSPGRAWMGLPLMAGDRVFGVMSVSSFNPDTAYSEENVQFFRAVADQTASILEKSRLYREMEQRARQLVILNEVGRTIASTLDLRTALNLIIDKAAEILGAEAASLFLVDQETEELVFEVAMGPTAPNLLGSRLPKGKGIVGTVAQTLEPSIVNNVATDKRWFGGYDKSGQFITQALIAVPMVYKDTAIGVIEVLNKKDGTPFSTGDLNLLQAFAAQSAVVIENARLYTLTDEALATRLEELQTLQRIDRELNASLDVERALDLTVEWAMRITGATAGLLGIVTSDGEGLILHAIHGYGDALEQYRSEPWPLERGIAGRVARIGFPNMVADVSEDPDYVGIVEGTRSQLTVPVPRENRVIGVITLESGVPGDFDLEDLNFVVRLADHASVAISNSQLYEEIKRANEYKSEFVSMVAHELKLPMQNIKGYADLLTKKELGGELNEMKAQFVSVIRSNVDRMNTLVSDLLEISRIETGRLRLDIQPTALQEVVQEAVNSLKQRIEDKQQTIEVNVPADLPDVMGDKGRLIQVLINLVSNAHKYTQEGGHIQVLVLPENHNGRPQVVCAIKDNGFGMSPEDVTRLGEKFFRASDQRVRNIQGHGLGLSIVKNLIQMHGGELKVESELGKGSTFSFNIPLANNTHGQTVDETS